MKTEIKSAETLEEMQALRPILQDFHALAQLPGTYDPGVENRLHSLVEAGVGAVFFAADRESGRPVGTIAGLVSEDLLTGIRMASELFWYTDPKSRNSAVALRLVDTFDAWAKASGAQVARMMNLTHLPTESVEKFYRRRGYHKVEQVWQRTF